MEDNLTSKAALLDDLKIDRSAPAKSGIPRLGLVALAALLVSLFAGWYFYSPQSQADPIPVTAITVRDSGQSSAGSVLDATGYVIARRQATVSSKATGKVVKVLIEEGLLVSEGQLLATLDDSIPRAQFELAKSRYLSAKAAVAEIEIALKQSRLDLTRTQGLADQNLASAADLDRDALSVEALIARLARVGQEVLVSERSMAVQKQLLDDMQIRAPFDGVVIAKAAQPGEMISPVSAGGGFTRTGICTIVDMDSLEVEVDVNESYINRVSAGQPVEVLLNAYPDHKYAASVVAIIPAADRNKATVRVRIGFLDKDDRVLPDMGVRVAFLEEKQPDKTNAKVEGLLIPRTAIAEDGNKKFVYVIKQQAAERRTVRSGQIEGEKIRVLTGLKNGERIIANLDDELAGQLYDGAPVQIQRTNSK